MRNTFDPVDERTVTEARRGENYGGRSRQERASDRRDRILVSALHLFGTRAYEDITVADVCSGAKVSKRYFYEHFVDRADLLWELHRQQNGWLLRGVAEAAPRNATSLEDVIRPAAGRLVGMLKANPERAQVIYLNVPRMETRRRGVLREDAQFFARMLRQATGRPITGLRIERLLLALVAGLSEMIIDWLTHGMKGETDELAEHITELCLAVLKAAVPI